MTALLVVLSTAVAGLVLWSIWQSAATGALEDRTRDLSDRAWDLEEEVTNLKARDQGISNELRQEFEDLFGPSWTDIHGNIRPVKMMAETHIRNCLEGGFVKGKETRDAMWKELAYREEARRWAKKTKVAGSDAVVYDEVCNVDFKTFDKIFGKPIGNPKGLGRERLLLLVDIFQQAAIAYGCRNGGDTRQPAYLEMAKARKELIDAIKEIVK